MKKTLSQKQIEFARMIAKLLLYANAVGIPVKIAELYRSQFRQTILYDHGKSKTLNSKHLKGLAVDLAIIKEGRYITDIEEYEPLGVFWELLGGVWGGSWRSRDGVHFEYKE